MHTHLSHELQVQVKALDPSKPRPNGKTVHFLHPPPGLHARVGVLVCDVQLKIR